LPGGLALRKSRLLRHQDLYQVKSSLILQHGPAAMTDGFGKLLGIIEKWATRR
jgi:hypothetical protein